MVGIIKSFIKTSIERKRLYLDYSCYLADDELLTDFQTVVRPLTSGAPLILNLSYPDAERKRLMMYVSGGMAGVTYSVRTIANTSQQQTKTVDLGYRVTA